MRYMSALDGLSAPRYRLGMAKEIPSVGDLSRKSRVTGAEIASAGAPSFSPAALPAQSRHTPRK